MRRLVQQLLQSVDPVNFPAEKIIQGSSFDEQLRGVPELPFIIHRFSIGRRSTGIRSSPGLDVWIYDVPGSYRLIDDTLVKVRDVLSAVSDLRTVDGLEHIAVIDWTNDSADLPAEEFGGITRMGSFILVGSTA